MSDLVHQVVKNARNQQADFSQRRAAVVRVCGEEHTAHGNGGANVYLTLDNDMVYISELKFKLVLGSSAANDYDTVISWGTGKFKNPDEFIATYPVGECIDVDGEFGSQCLDYANRFWNDQVGRNIVGMTPPEAIGANRTTNAGTEFDVIEDWNALRKGDWVCWNGDPGHIAMAMSAPHEGSITVIGENQGVGECPGGGGPVSIVDQVQANFLGAFRYKL